jgi:hypothetical protein
VTITPQGYTRRDHNRLVAIPPADLRRGQQSIYVTPEGGRITGMRAWYPAGPLIAVDGGSPAKVCAQFPFRPETSDKGDCVSG